MNNDAQQEVIDELMRIIIQKERASLPTMIIMQIGPPIKIDPKDIIELTPIKS